LCKPRTSKSDAISARDAESLRLVYKGAKAAHCGNARELLDRGAGQLTLARRWLRRYGSKAEIDDFLLLRLPTAPKSPKPQRRQQPVIPLSAPAPGRFAILARDPLRS
jgi:hypothetical protein